ncbi:MAG: 50S ribosomal protein L21 [Minisyncoccia bacterium]|jgi:large subunit ribosomal protein L21
MIAVIETGGKQYLIKPGAVITVEKIAEAKEGEKLSFDKVLLTAEGDKVNLGKPYLKDTVIEADVLKIGRSRKVTIFKYKNKTRYSKKQGHRQPFVQVKVK